MTRTFDTREDALGYYELDNDDLPVLPNDHHEFKEDYEDEIASMLGLSFDGLGE